MARGFIKGDRDQMFLLPPSVDDWVSRDHPVRFVQACLEQMNLQSFYESYAIEGRPPYDPQTMFGILVYAYSKSMRSSRKISKACEDEIPFRWISGNIAPDHRAICRFRTRHEKEFRTLFNETLRLCSESGLFNLGKIFLDGTKVKEHEASGPKRGRKPKSPDDVNIKKKAKAHCGFDINHGIPNRIFLTEGNGGERPFVSRILSKGQTGIMDRGYQSHKEFDLLQEENKHFVCRIKARTTRTIVKKSCTSGWL